MIEYETQELNYYGYIIEVELITYKYLQCFCYIFQYIIFAQFLEIG